MLIILGKDKTIRKKLCDLLDRERIINVDSITSALETICKFNRQINIVVARIDFLPDIYKKQIVNKICERLFIKIPSVVGYYTKDDLKVKRQLEKLGADYELVEYNEEDPDFPEKYLKALSKVYPDLVYDINKAKAIWQGKPEARKKDYMDLHKWLEEEGFGDVIERIISKEKNINEVIPSIEELLKKETAIEAKVGEDYKQLYLEMKEKYERLSRFVQELIDFVKKM